MTDSNATTHKTCSRCGETFPATSEYFYKLRTSHDGLHPSCKICRAAQDRAHRQTIYHPDNHEKLMRYRQAQRENARKRRAINPEKSRANEQRYHAAHREQRREHSSRYRANNLEQRRQKDRHYHAAHQDKARERVRRYRLTSTEKVRQRERLQRLRRRAAGKVTKEDLAQLWITQDGCCAYCHCSLVATSVHVDHIKPVSKGGKSDPDNLCITCPRCNLSKNDRTPEEWTNRWYENQSEAS